MTANQIAYYRAQEERRANLAKEAIESGKLSESHRANLAQESIGYTSIGEQRRHNEAQESIDFYKASNLATLQHAQADKATSEIGVQSTLAGLQEQSVNETARHNSVQEQLTKERQDQQAFAENFGLGVEAGRAAIGGVRGIFGLGGLLK